MWVASAGTTLTTSNLQPRRSALTKVGAGTMAVNNVRTNALRVFEGAVQVLPNGGAGGVKRRQVTRPGHAGKLDLTDNDLIVDYTGQSSKAQVRQWVKDGRAPARAAASSSTPGSPTTTRSWPSPTTRSGARRRSTAINDRHGHGRRQVHVLRRRQPRREGHRRRLRLRRCQPRHGRLVARGRLQHERRHDGRRLRRDRRQPRQGHADPARVRRAEGGDGRRCTSRCSARNTSSSSRRPRPKGLARASCPSRRGVGLMGLGFAHAGRKARR